jgi:hypothetical protein
VGSNVAFFPGFPLLARGLRDLTGLPTRAAEALTAQLACWGFWTYLLLTWRRWRVPGPLALAGALAVLAHPAAFFLVCGYSESLFLFGAVGFLYWARSSRRVALQLAALHGGAMSATRLVGIPLAAVPFVEGLLSAGPPGSRIRRLIKPALLTALASLGALAFFAWCHFRFGHWDLYQQTQAVGWGVHPNYRAAFDWHRYTPVVRLSLRWSSWTNAYFWSRLTLPMTVLLLAALLWSELRSAREGLPGRRMRAGLYLGAWLIFYVSVSAMADRGGELDCMLRHQLATHVLLVLAAVHSSPWRRRGPLPAAGDGCRRAPRLPPSAISPFSSRTSNGSPEGGDPSPAPPAHRARTSGAVILRTRRLRGAKGARAGPIAAVGLFPPSGTAGAFGKDSRRLPLLRRPKGLAFDLERFTIDDETITDLTPIDAGIRSRPRDANPNGTSDATVLHPGRGGESPSSAPRRAAGEGQEERSAGVPGPRQLALPGPAD